MDDTILIEPMLGARPWMAMATAEQCTRNALGPKTLNEEKDLVEGKARSGKTHLGPQLQYGEGHQGTSSCQIGKSLTPAPLCRSLTTATRKSP